MQTPYFNPKDTKKSVLFLRFMVKMCKIGTFLLKLCVNALNCWFLFGNNDILQYICNENSGNILTNRIEKTVFVLTYFAVLVT